MTSPNSPGLPWMEFFACCLFTIYQCSSNPTNWFGLCVWSLGIFAIAVHACFHGPEED